MADYLVSCRWHQVSIRNLLFLLFCIIIIIIGNMSLARGARVVKVTSVIGVLSLITIYFKSKSLLKSSLITLSPPMTLTLINETNNSFSFLSSETLQQSLKGHMGHSFSDLHDKNRFL